MQVIINLFSLIATLLSGIFGNVQTLGTQVLLLGEKLVAALIRVRAELIDRIAAAKAEAIADFEPTKQSVTTLQTAVNNMPLATAAQINQAKNETLSSARTYADGLVENLKISTEAGMRGYIGLKANKDTTVSMWDASLINSIRPQLNGTGQYVIDITVTDGDGTTVTDGSVDVEFGALGGFVQKVEHDEKVIVKYDETTDAFTFVVVDENYNQKMIDGLIVSLEGLKQVAEAAKLNTDTNKQLIDAFLNSI